MSGGSTEGQVALITDFGARVLCSTPSYARAIADVAEQHGIDLRASALAIGIFGGEPWSEAVRREIEERLGLIAIDIYCLSEIMGPGVACECRLQQGMHGWEDHFLFEVIDPETGRSLPEGETGELVITTLTKEAMPLLRYRTRDVTRLVAGRCDCGRTHRRILRITGRSDDMLSVRGVDFFPSQIEEVLVGRPGVAPHFLIVIEPRGTCDHVRVEIETRPGVGSDRHDAIARDVADAIRSIVGIVTEVAVRPRGSVPRSIGKAVRVRDLRPNAGDGVPPTATGAKD
jgi:phenylacetate-CoA ligase